LPSNFRLQARTSLYLEICAAACQAGTDVLREGGTAVEAAARATIVLEDAGETNAGWGFNHLGVIVINIIININISFIARYGSNLTEAGTVEMDAGLMDGSSLLFGAVGALAGVKNPVMVAQRLVEEQQKGLLPLGRVPPGFLVSGANNQNGSQSVWPNRIIPAIRTLEYPLSTCCCCSCCCCCCSAAPSAKFTCPYLGTRS
jgi:taspase (threonine aspartase 1)